jgi:hypothetical protein
MADPNNLTLVTDPTNKDGWNITMTIVVILLVIIVMIMGYNYYVVYNCSSRLDGEGFGNDANQNPDTSKRSASDHVVSPDHVVSSDTTVDRMSNTSLTNTPLTTNAINNAMKYNEGDISPELKKHMADAMHTKPEVDQTKLSESNNPKMDLLKSDKPHPKIMKIAIYHMAGCGHCEHIMNPTNDALSEFDKLNQMFKDLDVKVYDFKLGVEPEADKYRAFPVIKFISINGEFEYNGRRDADSIAKAAIQNFYPDV